MDHLRAQVSASQTLLAEKLSLQRQLSAAEVELETERRASQRALAKEDGNQAHNAKIETQLESIQSELSKERRERQKAEREAQRVSSEFEGKKTILESRLDAFRNKLRMTKDQLKVTQDELQKSRASTTAIKHVHDKNATNFDVNLKNPKKRSLAQTDATIGTPGNSPAPKKSKRGSTIPGDKSLFSITPFLNRTGNIAPDTPEEEAPKTTDKVAGMNIKDVVIDDDDGEVSDIASPSGKPGRVVAKKIGVEKFSQEEHTELGPARPGKVNARKPARKTKLALALEQVVEEDTENQPVLATELVTNKSAIGSAALNEALDESTIVKKKRKVLSGGLGRTLFDEDDVAPSRGSNRSMFGGKSVPSLGRVGLMKTASRGGAGLASAFGGSFSPLKKDRKLAGL